MEISIKSTAGENIGILNGIYNRCAEDADVLYRPLDKKTFTEIFDGEDRLSFTALLDGVAVGFVSGSTDGSGRSFLSFVGVLPEYRRFGIGSALLSAFEAAAAERGAVKAETVFYDSASLPWTIPGTSDGHPCAPGTLSDSSGDLFLRARGYSEWCAQIAYYLPLSDYSVPQRTAEKRKSLEQAGFVFGLYSPAEHKGLYEIFDRIGNPGWRDGVIGHPELPTAVAADTRAGGRIAGFIGALRPVREGEGIRGVFCGVGTDPDYRGRGIATVLFAEMCRYQKLNGATFMSLYTGETMSARKVYESCGCVPVARFSNLRKLL